jgi:predicted amidophosphoribosyltransferase
MPLLQSLLDLVFAPVCLGCDGLIAPGDTARLVCRRCRTRLRAPPAPVCGRCGAPLRMTGRANRLWGCDECAEWPPALSLARACCILEPPADRLVHQLKYRGWRGLAQPLGERMAGAEWPASAHEPAVLVPVPTTAKRLRARGYNQAALLADSVASGRDVASGLPRDGAAHERRAAPRPAREVQHLLERVSGTRTQTDLQPAARAANVAGAFARTADVTGLHVILVDDVLTTGATAAECARVLCDAGACCVRLLTFARAFELRGLTQT